MAFQLQGGLPVIPIRIGHCSAYKVVCARRLDLPSRDLEVLALIDTGASITLIDESIVESGSFFG